jgi:hypothetical protein
VTQQPKPPKLDWYAILLLVLLVGVIVLGLADQGLTGTQWFVAGGFGAGVLVFAWLWQRTQQQAEKEPPLSWWQWVWGTVALVI